MIRLESETAEFKRITWLASYPKSGNTWVRLFLESYILGSVPDIALPMRCATSDTFMAMYQTVTSVPVPKLDHVTMMYLRPAALLHLLTSSDSQVKIGSHNFDLLVKTHNLNILLDEGVPTIPKRYTNRALYITRDPRDVVLSLAHYFSMDLDKAVEFMGDSAAVLNHSNIHALSMLGSWSLHVKSWLGCDNFPILTVRYEDLIQDTKALFAKILIFLGFKEIDEKRFQRALSATKFDKLQRDEAERGFREVEGKQFFRQGTSGGWRTTLSKAQIDKLQEVHQEAMKCCGYLA